MIFRHQQADVFGSSEWELVTDDGHDTGIVIFDLRTDGLGFVVNDQCGDTLATVDTFAEAKQAALEKGVLLP